MNPKFFKKMKVRVLKEFMDLVILNRITTFQSSGYDIIRYIHEKEGILVGAGTIYSILYSLERMGLVKGETIGRKRIYSVTPKGESLLEDFSFFSEEIIRFTSSFFRNIAPRLDEKQITKFTQVMS